MADLKEKHGLDIRLNKIKEHADSYILKRSFKMFIENDEIRFKDIHKIVNEKTEYSESWTRKSLKKLEKEGFIESRKNGREKLYRVKK